jgi:hypothetical protein
MNKIQVSPDDQFIDGHVKEMHRGNNTPRREHNYLRTMSMPDHE